MNIYTMANSEYHFKYVQRERLASDDTFDQLRCPQNILIMVVLARKLKSDWNTIEQLRVI